MTTQPVPNLPLLRKVLDHIDAHPEEYDQRFFRSETSCGTAYCIAGHAAQMVGAKWWFSESVQLPGDGGSMYVWDAAAKILGLTDEEAGELFAGFNTRDRVQFLAEKIAARAGERL